MGWPATSGGGGGNGDVTLAQLTAAVRGAFDPADVGYDIVICIGQSNMEGNPDWDPLIDIGDPRISQFAGSSADASTYRKIINGSDPMYMFNGVRTGKVGPISWFGKAYLRTVSANRNLLVVPVAAGSTAMVDSTWGVGGALFNLTITQANLALAAALAILPNSRIVGIAMAQGEADANAGKTQAIYVPVCKAVIAGLRAGITGASNSWFLISGMVPEKIAANPSTYGAIDLAHKQVCAETNKAWFVAGPSGFASDVHYTAPGIRIQGTRLGLAAQLAAAYVAAPVEPVAATAVTMSGPTSGINGVASTNFTLGVSPGGGIVTGTVVVTPSDSAGGGTFAPTSASLTTASPNATFTYTPASTGAKTISVTNNGSLANPSNITYTVSASATAPAQMAAPTAVGGDTIATVTLVAPSNGGSAITGYTVVSSPPGMIDTDAGTTNLVHDMTGGTNFQAYTFTATATNGVGTSPASPASNSVTPAPVALTYATWNPSDKGATVALSNGNLTATKTGGTSGHVSVRATVSISAGKKYWENTMGGAPLFMNGVGKAAATLAGFVGSDANGWGYYSANGQRFNSNTGAAFGATYAVGDVLGFALDMDAGTLQVFKGNVSQGTITGLTGPLFPMITVNAGAPAGFITTNFGATPFAFTPPVGFTGVTA